MGSSEKGNNENGQILESKASQEDEFSLPEDLSVKFINCKCGALIDSSEPECWSCGKKFKQKGKKESKNTPDTVDTKVPEEDVKLESKVTYTNFISCPNCGSNNEIYSAETKCWFCSKIMDTKKAWEQLVFSSKEEVNPIDENNEDKVSEETKNKDKSKKEQELEKLKPSPKKALLKYVLHCSKCNSWFITNDYSSDMECNSCGKKNTLAISYTCSICNRFFDLNTITKQDCPYCKKPLGLTKEEALY